MIATEQQCPKCSGPMWDETKSKFYDASKNKPIAKCKDKACDGAIWPPKNAARPAAAAPQAKQGFSSGGPLPGEQQETGAPPVTNGAVARLDGIFSVYSACFAFASSLAHETLGADCTHEGISAMAATCFIASKS